MKAPKLALPQRHGIFPLVARRHRPWLGIGPAILLAFGLPGSASLLRAGPGQVDTNFNAGTGADGAVRAIALQSDGRIIIGGAFQNFNGVARKYLARIEANGSLDPSFNSGAGPNSDVSCVAVQADGKILAGGQFTSVNGITRNRLVRFNADGTLDSAFNPNIDSFLRCIVVQPDGKILIGGGFNTINGLTRYRLARLNANGVVDNNFDVGPSYWPNGTVNSIAVRPDGRVVIGGEFNRISGSYYYNGVGQYDGNGVFEPSWNPGSGAGGSNPKVYGIALQPDGKLTVAGFFTYFSDTPRGHVARLNSNGSLDTGFATGAGASTYTYSLLALPDGKTLIGGAFTNYNGTARKRLARLLANGSLDSTFDPGAGASDVVSAMALQPDGKILIGGYFTNYNNVACGYITRLEGDPPSPPQITQQPQDRTVRQYQTTNLTVTAVGTPPLYYQWYFQGNPITNGTAAVLSLPNAQPSAAGEYYVVITNLAGAVTSTVAVVTVLVYPTLVQNPQSQVVEAGATAILTVLATGTEPIGYQWWKDGAILPGETGTNLVITNFQLANAGEYYATISNVLGLAYSSAVRLDLAGPPIITAHPTNTAALEWDYASFKVVATGTQPLSYQWYKDGQPVPLVAGDVLVITPVTANEVGGYTVVISNALGAVTSQVATLTLLQPPSILQPPASQFVWAGATVAFGVGVGGTAPFAYQWRKNNSDLPGQTNASLLLTNVQRSDEGQYAVRVSNAYGHITSTTAVLQVYGPGSVDLSFDPGLGPNDAIESVAVGAGDHLAVGGWFTSFNGLPRGRAARLLPDGALDPDFNPGTGANSAVYAVATLANGQTLVAGQFTDVDGLPRNRLVRFEANGQVDTNFNPNLDSFVRCMAVQPDGKIMIGGGFNTVNGATRYRLARLNGDGTTDPSFDANGNWPNGTVEAIALRPDGKVLAGGQFNNLSGTGFIVRGLAQYDATGAVDTAFGPFNGPSGVTGARIYSLALQPDGKLVVGGYFTYFNDAARGHLARLNLNGTLDASFPSGAGALGSGSTIRAILLQPDGRMFVAGYFTNFNGQARRCVARLNGDGSVDPLFDPGSGPSGNISSLALQSDGRLVAAGLFTNFSGVPRNSLVRLETQTPTPPGFIAPLSSLTAIAGQSNSLSVNMAGSPHLAYQWLKEGQPLPGQTNNMLVFDPVRPEDAGNYWVVVTNRFGSVTSAVAALTVIVPVSITQQPRSLAAPPNGDAVFTVAATGTPPIRCQWLFEGMPLPDATNFSLTVSSVQPGQAAGYSAVLSNAAGAVTSLVALLNLVQPPQISQQPLGQTARIGGNASFVVTASGEPPLRYQWRKGGVPLPGQTGPALVLRGLLEDSAGVYDVLVSNSVGCVASESATLTLVEGPPLDTDGDGIPDVIELAHGFDPRWRGDALLDADGDGQINLFECLAGTNPRHPGSVFKVSRGPEKLPAGGWRLHWTGVAGKKYQLQRWNSEDLAHPGNPPWIEVVSVIASGEECSVDDPQAGNARRQFYRLILDEPTATGGGPVVSAITAEPSPALSEGTVVLLVVAQDTNTVAGVNFYDGPALLGAASQVGADTWRLLWTVDHSQAGQHQISALAFNLLGETRISPVLAYSVAVTNRQLQQNVGRVAIRADGFQTNNSIINPSGNVRLGLVRLQGSNQVDLAPATGMVSGWGQVAVPGLGTVFQGAFELDPVTGWMLYRPPRLLRASPQQTNGLAPIPLNAGLTLFPEELSVNVNSGALRGRGIAWLRVLNFALTNAAFDGSFDFDPATQTVVYDGTMSLGGVTGAGRHVIRVATAEFLVSGTIHFPAGTAGEAVDLTGATLDLKYAAGNLPALTAAGLRNQTPASGSVEADGSLRLAAPPPTPAVVLANPDQFVPLGPDGQPLDGLRLQARADGSLPPFEYRPVAASALGKGQHLFIRFPNGATVVSHNGRDELEFVQARAGFGPASPLQLEAPLERLAGAPRRLPLGPLDFNVLAALFDRDPRDGLPVRLFNKLALLWKGGLIDEGGIRAGMFEALDAALPLPKPTEGYPGWTLSFGASREIAIPFYGEFALLDGSAHSPRLMVTRDKPLWLGVRGNGQIWAKGRAELVFPDGPRFQVDFGIDDPNYHLQLVADGLHFHALRGLGQALPSSAAALLPGPNPTALQIDEAILGLRQLDQASLHFNAALSGLGMADGMVMPDAPPIPFSLAGAALEAWSFNLLSGARQTLSALDRQQLVKQAWQKASAARHLESVLRQYVALARAGKAGFAGGDPETAASLNSARETVLVTAVKESAKPESVASLKAMRESLGLLVEAEALIQLSGSPSGISDARLQNAMSNLICRFTSQYLGTLGVRVGQFTPNQNLTIGDMDRYVAQQTLHDLADLLADAQKLGLDQGLNAPLPEALGQLAYRLEAILGRELAEAERQTDYLRFMRAMLDYFDLLSLHEAGIIPQSAEAPAMADLETRLAQNSTAALGQKLSALALADATWALRTPQRQAEQIRQLLDILRQVPPQVTFDPQSLRRAYDDAEAALAGAIGALGAESRPATLTDLLELGIVHAAMRDRFSYQAPVSWEDARLAALVDRLALKAFEQKSWSELHRGAEALLAEAGRQRTNNHLARSSLYLAQAAKLLEKAHAVSVALLETETSRRADLQLVDMLLPGDISVDKLFGSVRYNRLNRELQGAFGGQLRMPKFNLALEIQNASFSTGGAFDLSAFGTVSVPPESTAATLTIPARNPFHVSFRPPNDLRLSGAAEVAIQNGGPGEAMRFEAHADLADPLYSFGFSAGGLRFGMATNIYGTIPVPDLAALQNFGPDARLAFNDYFAALAATAEPLAGLIEPPVFAALGEPPDFGEAAQTSAADPFNAAARALRLALQWPVELGLVPPGASAQQISDALAPVATNLVNGLRQEAQRAASEVLQAKAAFLAAPIGEPAAARRLAALLREQARMLNSLTGAVWQAQSRLPGFAPGDPAQQPELQAYYAAILEAYTAIFDHSAKLQTAEDALLVLEGFLAAEAAAQRIGWSGGAAVYNQAIQVVLMARALLLNLAGLEANGEVGPEEQVFRRLDDSRLARLLRELLEIEQTSQLLGGGGDAQTHARAVRNILLQRRALALAELKRLRAAKFPSGARDDVDGLRQERVLAAGNWLLELHSLMQLNGLEYQGSMEHLDGTTGTLTESADFNAALGLVSEAAGKLARYLDSGAAEFDPDYLALFNSRGGADWFKHFPAREHGERLRAAKGRADAQVNLLQSWQASLDSLAKRQLARLQSGGAAVFQFPFADAEEAGRGLVGLALVITETGLAVGTGGAGANANEAAMAAFEALYAAYAARVQILAEAQRAWWLVNRANQVLLEGLAGKLNQDLNTAETAAYNAATATMGLGRGMLAAFKNDVLLKNRRIDLSLPGDVLVRRVAGDVTYNRRTGLLSGSFSGRVEFPDLPNAFFEIQQATLNNNLQFSIDAITSGPLPVEGVTLTAQVHAAGGRNLPIQFTGAGTLVVRDGPTFNATVGFDQAQRRLSFDGQAGNLQSLRFTDNLVLFNAGFGFTIHPQGAELRANGSAGFFAKGALPEPPARENFHLMAENAQAVIAYQPGRVDIVLSNGTLRLPDIFEAGLCPNPPAHGGPSISLNPAHPIRATFLSDPQPPASSLSFSGELQFANLGIKPTSIEGLGAELCAATFIFDSDRLPVFTNINGVAKIPLPKGQTTTVEIIKGAWSLDGLPSGTIALGNDLTLLDQGGVVFTLMGRSNENCAAGCALTVHPAAPGQIPTVVLSGGIKLTLPASMLTGAEGDTVASTVCGSLTLPPPPEYPRLALETLEFSGNFHLGGADGLLITNALISIEGLTNLFDLSDDRPLVFRIGGALHIPSGPAFMLEDAKFTFFDPRRLPRFSVAALGYDATQFDLVQMLPARVSKATLRFLEPSAELPYYLAPTNLELTISADVKLPPGAENPVIAGRVDNVSLRITPEGLLAVRSIAGLGLEIGGFNLPPIEDIGGKLYIGGLENPQTMYFAGKAAGSYNGYKIKLIVAVNMQGPIGVCLDVNAGNVGIPLGQTGFLITGASGGYSFLNKNASPCDFTSYIDPDGKPLATFNFPAVISWETLRSTIQRAVNSAAALAPIPQPPTLVRGSAADGCCGASLLKAALPRQPRNNQNSNIECPGPCPPPTINIFCQPHPDQAKYPNRVIAKFTSISEPVLNDVFGIRRDTVAALGSSNLQIATNLASRIRSFVTTNVPPPNPELLPGDRYALMVAAINEEMNAMEAVCSEAILSALQTNQASDKVYDIIREVFYAGAPCADITLMVSGTFTHMAVSAFLSGTVGGMISSAGSGGFFGYMNTLGMPAGQSKFFLAATDDQGLPNPSFCGQISLVFGPLEYGNLQVGYKCRDCVTGILREFGKMALCLGDPLTFQISQKVAPHLATNNFATGAQWLNAMSDAEKIAFMAELFQLPPEQVNGLADCFRQQFSAAMDVLQPYLSVCGTTHVKIFGLPTSVTAGEGQFEMTKTNMAGAYTFSVSGFLGWLFRIGELFPPFEEGSAGFNYPYPSVESFLVAALDGKYSSPESIKQYANESFDFLLQRATFTLSHRVNPLGFEVSSSQGRIIMPNLTNHPSKPGSGYIPIEQRFPENPKPSRRDLLIMMLNQHRLGDPFWTGTPEEMAALDARLAGLSFRHDYFPRGGLAGGMKVDFPKVLTEKPPPYLNALLDLNSGMQPLDRLLNAMDYIQNYLLQATNRAALTFYAPAPNPPYLTNSAGENLGPRELLQAIMTFDADAFDPSGPTPLYSMEEAFVQGHIYASLLGVPIATGIVSALPPGPERDYGLLEARINGPTTDWLTNFVTQADLVFELRQAPLLPISVWASNAWMELNNVYTNPPPNAEAAYQAKAQEWIYSLATNLPKVKLTADLALTMPDPIDDVLSFNGGAHLHAYSPRYETNYLPGDLSPLARARRNGGIALTGNFDLRAGATVLASIPNAELSVTPKDSGLPYLSGHFQMPSLDYGLLRFNNVAVDFVSDPNPSFAAGGTLTPVGLGQFLIEPLAGNSLTGQVNVARTGPNQAAAHVYISPAKLRLPSLYDEHLLIFGAHPNAPFEFNSEGPWTASLGMTSGLTLKAGGVTLVQLANGSMQALSFSGHGLNVGSVSARISGGSQLTIFPGTAYQQQITLLPGVDAAVAITNDGTFEISGSLGANMALNGLNLPVTGMSAGGTFRLTQNGLTVAAQASGGVLSTVGTPSGFTGQLTINRDGTASLSGNLTVQPFGNNYFRLESPTGGAITASLSNSGLQLSGVRFVAKDQVRELFRVNLPSFTVAGDGDFNVNFTPPASVAIGGFPMGSVSFELRRSGGLWAINNLAASLNVAGLGNLGFSGNMNNAGQLALTNTLASADLFGFPTARMTNILARAPGGYRAKVLADNPVAFWRLGEGSGTSATNENYAAGLNGTYVGGPALKQDGALADDANFAVSFNGSGQYVRVPHISQLNLLNTNLTIEAWVKVNAFNQNWQAVIAKGDSSWRLHRHYDSSVLSFDTTGTTPSELKGKTAVNDGQWHHVAAVFDGQKKYLFVDGRLDAMTPVTGSISGNSSNIWIGGNETYPARCWNGLLDEVAIYPRALAATEIAEHYQSGGAPAMFSSLNVDLGNFGSVNLQGMIGPDGVFQFQAGPVDIHFGSLPLTQGTVNFSSTGTVSSTTFAFDASLAIPGAPPARLSGAMNGAGAVNLHGDLANGALAIFELQNLAFDLGGTVTAPTLSAAGTLAVANLGSLSFQGTIEPNGEFALTNIIDANSTFLENFPIHAFTNVLRKAARNYRMVTSGDPLVPADKGDEPAGYWRLGETSGTNANDLSKNVFDHDGTYLGGVTLGQAGALLGDGNAAVRLDGSSGRVEIPGESAFDFATAVSVEAWIKVPSGSWSGAGAGWMAIVTKGDSSWRLSRYSNTRQVSFDTTRADGQHHSLPSVRNLDDGQWHHVAGVYDGQVKYLYVDGVLEAFAQYAETLKQNDYPVMIGANAEAAGRYFNGWMDEVAVYGHALTPGQVLDHYQAGGGAILSTRLKFNFGPLADFELIGGLATNGAAVLQAGANLSLGLSGFDFADGYLAFTRSPGQSPSCLLHVGGDLNINAAILDFDARMRGHLAANGQVNLQANGINATVLGYGFRDAYFQLQNDVNYNGALSAGGTLNLGNNFPPKTLSGTINYNNAVNLSWNGSLSLGGFTSAAGSLTLNNANGLRAGGSFDLSAAGGQFNQNFGFNGAVQTDGNFSLTGNGSLNIGGKATVNSAFTLARTGVTGNTTLQLGGTAGNLDISVSLTGLGISIAGSKNVDTGWIKFFDFAAPNNDWDIWARTQGTLSLSCANNGSLSGTFNCTFAVWEKLAGWTNPPDDINESNHRGSFNAAISSDGGFTINFSYDGVEWDPPGNNWGFDLW